MQRNILKFLLNARDRVAFAKALSINLENEDLKVLLDILIYLDRLNINLVFSTTWEFVDWLGAAELPGVEPINVRNTWTSEDTEHDIHIAPSEKLRIDLLQIVKSTFPRVEISKNRILIKLNYFKIIIHERRFASYQFNGSLSALLSILRSSSRMNTRL